MTNPKYSNLQEVQNDIQAGKTNVQDLVRYYLQQIETQQHLNVFLEVFADEALNKAAELDAKLEKGESTGRLAGMVMGIKDVICYKDHKVGAASKILEGFESLFSATAVERLLAEDAIIIGRLNCDEFAMGSTNEYSAYGKVLNARDNTKVPGGSSGGSAVAVQADMCLASLGSDTGGSVRQPASFCGVLGVKPTYGRISRHGLIAYASSFDQIGVLSHSVQDAALLLEIISGPDQFDSTAIQQANPAFSQEINSEQSYKIAYFKEAFAEGLNEEIKDKTLALIEQLKAKGHTVEALEFPLLEYVVPAYYVMTCAEASSNLSRYDGIHFGYRSDKAKDLQQTYTLSRTEGFGKEVRRRIMLGTFVLSSGFYDAYYTQAQKVRRLVSDATQAIFKNYDFILTPTAPSTAFGLDELIQQDPTTMYLADIYTVQANLVGIPAISLPLFEHSNGMPFGVQLMANKYEESKLLSLSEQLMGEI